jgi:hypothetical protein
MDRKGRKTPEVHFTATGDETLSGPQVGSMTAAAID